MRTPMMLRIFIFVIAGCALISFSSLLVMQRKRTALNEVDELVLRAMREPHDPEGDARRLEAAQAAIALMGATPWHHKPFLLAAFVYHQRGEFKAAATCYRTALELLGAPQKLRSGIPFRGREHELDRALARERLTLATRGEKLNSVVPCYMLHPRAARMVNYARGTTPPE